MTQRQEIIERLNGTELEGGSHEMLSAICKAVLPHSDAWMLRRCADLRDRLVRLLGEADTPHSSDGRITDELRKYISDMVTRGISPVCEKSLAAIADRIDAAHEEAIKSVMNDALYHANDKDMADLGWYRALDADKQPVRIGAEMDSDHYEDGTVVGLQFFDTANKTPRVLIAIRPHGWDTPTWRDPESYHHHHAPTVEDVLTEFAAKLIERGELTNGAAQTIAEYAKRLQLAGDAE